MARDSVGHTFLVAGVLCIACSVMVASVAVGLRPMQEANRELDRKANVLIAANLYEPGDRAEEINRKFDNIRQTLIEIDTGEPVPEGLVDLSRYDPMRAARDPEMSQRIPTGELPGITRRENYNFVYEVIEDGEVQQYIFPMYGMGLWSVLYGYLALDKDLNTVRGITFYQHGETPGLGAEISDNKPWQRSWQGKEVYDQQGEVALRVIKGTVDPNHPDAVHRIDGISGATITVRGVTQMLDYWLGPQGYGPFIDNQRQQDRGGSDG